ncbi:MAG: LysR family transcriptional regulator [Burkholderiaceae bacterium]
MNADALVLIATIADAGSLTMAARQLGVSQSALTKQLLKIEADNGVPLFTRGVRGVRLTEYGQALVPRARAIREEARRAGETLRQMRGEREGQVVLALSHQPTLIWLPRIIGPFRARWPLVSLRIMAPAFPLLLTYLREGTLDFAVVASPAEQLGAEYSVHPLYGASTMVAATRKGHPLAGARSLKELAGAQWATPSAFSSSSRALRRAYAAAGLSEPDCPVHCETLSGLEAIVRSTDLIGTFPRELFGLRWPANALDELRLDETLQSPSIALIRWADAQPTPAAAALAELFTEAAHASARAARPQRG